MLTGSLVGLLIVFGAFGAVTYGVHFIRGGEGTSRAISQYVTCGTPDVPENEGQVCGPAGTCASGVCVPTAPTADLEVTPAGNPFLTQ